MQGTKDKWKKEKRNELKDKQKDTNHPIKCKWTRNWRQWQFPCSWFFRKHGSRLMGGMWQIRCVQEAGSHFYFVSVPLLIVPSRRFKRESRRKYIPITFVLFTHPQDRLRLSQLKQFPHWKHVITTLKAVPCRLGVQLWLWADPDCPSGRVTEKQGARGHLVWDGEGGPASGSVDHGTVRV